MKKLSIAAIFVAMVYGTGFAQTSGADFLLEDSNTKSFSMGSAFTAYSDNPDSLNLNPAGIGFSLNPEISAQYKKNLVDGFNSSLFLSIPVKGSGAFGLGFSLYDLGSVEVNYLDGTSATVKAMQSMVANLGYSFSIINELALGVNLKYIKSTLADKYTGTAFAADCGLLFRTSDSSFSYGFALQNIGTSLTYISSGDPLPFTIRTGVALNLRKTNFDSWLLTADVVYYDSAFRYNAGVECKLFKTLAIRAGYKLGNKPDALTFGAGFNLAPLNIDYAYSMLGSMDNVQMFAVSYKFGPDKQQKLMQEQVQQEKYRETEKWTGKRIKIAVMNLESKNVSTDTAAVISDMLRNDLFELGKYSVIERANIDKILKEQALQQTGCTSTECAVEVGKILNVQQTIVGTVGKVGDKYLINVRLVDVETAELIGTASEECYTESDLTNICKAIASKLSQK